MLVATDLTRRSDHAVATAVRFAELGGAELVVMHVLDDADYPSYDVMPRDRWAAIRKDCVRQLLAVQRNSCGELTRSRTLLEVGVPSRLINAAARGNDVDLVVVGPRSGEGHLLGATADRVVRSAPCSVYVARLNDPVGE